MTVEPRNAPAHLANMDTARDVILNALKLSAATRLIEVCGDLNMTTTEAGEFRDDCEWLAIALNHRVIHPTRGPA